MNETATTPEKNQPTTLENGLKGLKDLLCDLSSIEIQTYVGDIDVLIENKTDPTDLEALLKVSGANGKLTLNLVTKINFDGDGFVLVPKTAPPDYVQDAHNAALAAGNDVRQGLISLFADVIGLKVSK